jgi:hypothetical protein
METMGKQIKLLLLLLALGVWGLLLRSFFPPSVGTTSGKRLYACTIDDQGKIYLDHSGSSLAFTGTGLVSVLDEAARQGVKIHSVMSPANGGGYIVLIEK